MKLFTLKRYSSILFFILGLGLNMVTFAATAAKPSGVKIVSKSMVSGCEQYPSEVCIVNHSNNTVDFSVPTLDNQNGSLPVSLTAEVYSYDYYSAIHVIIDDADFDQWVPNYSVIEIVPYYTAEKGNKKVKVIVKKG